MFQSPLSSIYPPNQGEMSSSDANEEKYEFGSHNSNAFLRHSEWSTLNGHLNDAFYSGSSVPFNFLFGHNPAN